jgi:glycosyltransferase involved in cell wall biosynthesis
MTLSVSIVSTVRDERDSIEAFLDSLMAQTRAADEIVIVDGGSSDGTEQAIRACSTFDGRVRLISAPGATIAQGRNIAISCAGGEIVAVTDAGTTIEPDWLERLTQPLETCGNVAAAAGFFRPGGVRAFERSLAAIITPHVDEVDPPDFLPSSRSLALRKEWWRRVGGYPDWLRHCEDLVFDLQLREAGARFVFVPDAVVSWRARPSLRGFFGQYADYARGDGHALLWPRRHAVRYVSYVTGLALLAAGRSRRPARAALVAGFALYASKYYKRIWRHRRSGLARRDVLTAAALVPVIVVTGDVAKMIGYPRGRYERIRFGGPQGLRTRLPG